MKCHFAIHVRVVHLTQGIARRQFHRMQGFGLAFKHESIVKAKKACRLRRVFLELLTIFFDQFSFTLTGVGANKNSCP